MDPGFVEDPGHVVVPGLDDADPRLEIAMMCSDQRSTSAIVHVGDRHADADGEKGLRHPDARDNGDRRLINGPGIV